MLQKLDRITRVLNRRQLNDTNYIWLKTFQQCFDSTAASFRFHHIDRSKWAQRHIQKSHRNTHVTIYIYFYMYIHANAKAMSCVKLLLISIATCSLRDVWTLFLYIFLQKNIRSRTNWWWSPVDEPLSVTIT